jgi:transaldolase
VKFFIDTADVQEIRAAHALGILDGVTTNPSLVAKTGRPFREVIAEILEICKGPVSVEVVATETEAMLAEAQEISTMGENVVIKLPVTADGLRATKTLSDRGVPVNNTLCFSALQALMSAKAGAAYISPFVGRLDDVAHNGMELIHDIRTIYDNYGYTTEILVASIRHPMHVLESAQIGADVCTIPFGVFDKLIKHPLTDLGLEAFLSDWAQTGESVLSS